MSDCNEMSMMTFISSIRTMEHPKLIEKYRRNMNAIREINFKYSPEDALRFAIMYNHTSYSKYLLKRWSKEALNTTACCPLLLHAVTHNCVDILGSMCHYSQLHNIMTSDGDAYIDAKGCVAMEGSRTALHIAAETGQVECCRVLLNHGASTKITDGEGMTPLQRCLSKLTASLDPNRPRTRKSDHHQERILCIIDLLKCERVLDEKTKDLLTILLDTLKTNDLMTMSPIIDVESPPSLLHQSRVAIRQHLADYKILPEAISYLAVPKLLTQYIELVY